MSVGTLGRAAAWACIAIPVVIGASVLWLHWPDSEPDSPSINITSVGPAFTALEDLAAASDLVAVGTIGSVASGRTITDPANPDAGIRTTLYTLRVETVLAGQASGTITIEHETALLDGTPITVDGAEPPASGERGLYFLVAGRGAGFPYHAVIGAPGRYLIDGHTLVSSGADSLSRTLDGSTVAEIAGRIASLN